MFTAFPDQLFTWKGTNVGQGRPIYVRPYDGADGNAGNAPILQRSVKTLTAALALATADQNDRIMLLAQSNTAANTTDYQTTSLLWNKDGVHLIGVNAGPAVSQRSRIASPASGTSATVAAAISPLVTHSADGCLVENVQFFQGYNHASAVGCHLVSGSRNRFRNVHFAGIGIAAQDTASNYSLSVTGSENVFEDCTIGLDTITRAQASAELLLGGGATRNLFRRCRFITYGTANHLFLKIAANGIDRWNLFDDCEFINMPTGVAAGTTMTQAFDITGGGSPDGLIRLRRCTFTGVTNVETTPGGKVYRDDTTCLTVATTVPAVS